MSKLADAVRRCAEYLDALADNMLKNDADMLLDECRDPKDVANELRAALAADGDDVRELVTALREAKNIARIFHNLGGPQAEAVWPIYERSSPEMKRINAILAKYAPPQEKP